MNPFDTVQPDSEIPTHELHVGGRRPERVLLVCDPVRFVDAARWQRRSEFPVTLLDVRAHGWEALPQLMEGGLTWPASHFDAIVVWGGREMSLDPARMRAFAGARVLVSAIPRAAKSAEFHVCVPASKGAADPGLMDTAILEAVRLADTGHAVEWSSGIDARNILVLVPHRPRLDPRLGWLTEGAPAPLMVHQLGVHEDGTPTETLVAANGALQRSVQRQRHSRGEVHYWDSLLDDGEGLMEAVQLIGWMEHAFYSDEAVFLRLIGSWARDQRTANLRDMFGYCLDMTATLVREGSRFRNVDAIIAADVPTLPAAYILGSFFHVPVVFDAHEYWPQADLGNSKVEERFWERVERRLVRPAAFRATVSTGLAAAMAQRYGVPYMVLPNAEPASRLLSAAAPQRHRARCDFVFQGVFAQGRGLELLIRAWPRVHPNARLVLRGPDGEYRRKLIELTRRAGLLESRVVFPPAVLESELIAVAAEADVGLAPYEPRGLNHLHCCPNKVSQFMAAGLPILANATEFVREVVQAGNAGLVVDFGDEVALVAAVDRLTCDIALRNQLAANAREHFVQRFNWESLSREFYASLVELAGEGPSAALALFDPGSGLASLALAPVAPVAAAPSTPVPHRRAGMAKNFARFFWNPLPERVKQHLRPLVVRARAVAAKF